MNCSTKWVSALALSTCLMTQGYSYATNTTPLLNESLKTQETAEVDLSSLQDTLQGLKNFKPVSQLFINNFKNTPIDKLKNFEIALIQDQEFFDEWVQLILKNFSKDCPFDHSLEIAKERGEQKVTPAAQCNLAMMHEKGVGVDKDLVKAIQLYEAIADQGYAPAQSTLGYFYKDGIDVDKDLVKARRMYEAAANQGYAPAQGDLAFMYITGLGVNKDLVKAIQLYEAAADQGHADAQFNLGIAYHNGQDVRKDLMKAKEYFQKAADQGHALAQNSLGVIYMRGLGVDNDPVKSREYFQKAAEQGDIQAQNNLAIIYKNGIDIDQDLVKAAQLYKAIADRGDAKAQYNVAKCLQGPYGDQNTEDVRKWFQKAADQEFAPAQIELAKFYRYGLGGEKNLYEAWNLYEKLMKAGDRQFSQIITDLYQDITQQYEDIIAQENADSQYKLGLICNNTWSGHRDVEKAKNLFRKAGQQGHAEAQYYLGLSYHVVPENQKDLSKALYWYLKAAQEQHLEPDMARRVKNYIQIFVRFNTCVLSLDDEKHIQGNQSILRDNIAQTLGIFDKQRGLNQQSLAFQEANMSIPSLFPLYDNIVEFQVNLLKIINILNHSGVMVSCLQPREELELFKANNNPFIKCYRHDETSYLIFGDKNIETGDPLMTILLGQNPISQKFKDSLSDLTEIYKLSQTMLPFHILETEDRVVKSQNLMATYNNAIKDAEAAYQLLDLTAPSEIVEQHKSVIRELQAKALQVQINYQIAKNPLDEDDLELHLEQASNFHQQVLDIMIEGSPLRNKIYLNDNSYIKDLFQ